MARKKLTHTIESEGRDKGKVFLITEKSALDAERWARHALISAVSAGANIPQDAVDAGAAGLATLAPLAFGILVQVPAAESDALMASLDECIQRIPNASNPNVVRPTIPDDIEEVGTLFELRKQALMLHVNFSQAGES